MYLIKDKTFDELTSTRHKLEIELDAALIEDKEKRIQKFTEDRNAVKAQIQGLADYQTGLAEEAKLRDEIFNAGVDLEMKQIKVKELEDITEYLSQKKDELTEAKRLAEIKNEELKKEALSREDMAIKRLQAKLQRDKNIEVKELIAQEETAKQHNHELAIKLDEEKKKHDDLLEEKLELDEKMLQTNI
jgi:hypothetical protein